MPVAISDREYATLSELIRARLGMHYDESKQFLLQGRLQTRLLKCRMTDFASYAAHLQRSPDRDTEWDEIASLLCNNETYFFRERAQLDVLAGEVFDAALRAGRPLRVWSAACSTGEEPLTLAMQLLETGRASAANVRIAASDLSLKALAKAAEGFYRELSFRATPPQMIQRYFKARDSGFVINDEVKRLVEYGRRNLLDDRAVAAAGPVDAIFCRNVLIYFDKPTQKRVVESLARALRPNGYLFLGHAESVMRLTDAYEPVVTPKAIYYRKRNDA